MKIINGLSLCTIAGNHVVVPVGETTVNFKGMVVLNGCGAYLWEQLESGKSEDELVQAIQNEYEIDEWTATSDVKQFVEVLVRSGFVQ